MRGQVTRRSSTRTRLGEARAVLFAAGAGLALLVAGCGGGKPRASVASLGPTTTGTTTTSTGSGGGTSAGLGSQTNAGGRSGGRFTMVGGGSVEQLTEYAGCMRKNGVPSFPDPNAQGQITFSGNGVDPGSAQFQQAQQACQKLLPNGGQPTPAEQSQARANALAFSACMRSHGVPNFPDPQFGSGGRVSISINQSAGIDPRSPQFQTAQKACQKNLPGAVGSKDSGADSSGGQGRSPAVG